MGIIIIHKPPEAEEGPVIDFNLDAADTERAAWIRANKDAILAKVSDAIDRL